MKTNEDEVLCTEPVCTQTERYNQIKEPNNPFSFWTSVNQDSHCTIEHQLSENRPITQWKPYISGPGVTTFRKNVSPMPYYSTQQNYSQKQSTLSLSKRSVNTVRKDVSKEQHMMNIVQERPWFSMT